VDQARPAVRELDGRTPAAIGRQARLELAFEVRGARTILARSYAEPPFRIGPTFDLGGAAYVIIVCAGPGVFGGDALRQTVHVGRGARVVLASQAALQVHPSSIPLLQSCNPAILQCRYVVAPDAELHCVWDPVIPFARARLDHRFDVRVDATSRLYWSDALMAGRVSRGEVWRFASLAHELALRVGGSLVYLERYAIEPESRGLNRRWAAGTARYFATTIVHHRDASSDIAERWHRASASDCVRAATDLVAPRVLVTRAAAVDGAPFARFRASNRAAALDDIFCAPELAARK
jgi:urease accessory protein UreH